MSKAKTSKKIVPIGQWILVRPVVYDHRKTESGLFLPMTEEKEQKAQGTVESVGDQVKMIKAGETIVYGAYVGENLKIREGKEEIDYKLILEEDVIALIK